MACKRESKVNIRHSPQQLIGCSLVLLKVIAGSLCNLDHSYVCANRDFGTCGHEKQHCVIVVRNSLSIIVLCKLSTLPSGPSTSLLAISYPQLSTLSP